MKLYLILFFFFFLLFLIYADTVHPTAYISASTSFTNAPNVTVYISFSEPCTGEGGFKCSTVENCHVSCWSANLLLYDLGQSIKLCFSFFLFPLLDRSMFVWHDTCQHDAGTNICWAWPPAVRHDN